MLESITDTWTVDTLIRIRVPMSVHMVKLLIFQAGQHLAHQLEVGASGSDLCAFLRMSRSTASQSMHNSSTTSLQYLALQEELSDAKERNVQLAARLQQKEADLNEARKDLEEVAKEKEHLREKVTHLEV